MKRKTLHITKSTYKPNIYFKKIKIIVKKNLHTIINKINFAKKRLKMKKIIILLSAITILASCKKETGCTDPTARNFNSSAEVDDGTCVGSAYSGSNLLMSTSVSSQVGGSGSNTQSYGPKEYKFKALPAPPINHIYAIHFHDENTGWVAGSYGKLLKTTNGGTSWTEYSTPLSYRIEEVCFVDEDYGWISSYDGIAKTTDGGKTWTKQYTPEEDYETSGVTFVNREKGWICGDNGLLMETNDGGDTWNSQSIDTDGNFYDVFFLNENDGWAVGAGRSPMEYSTNDGGKTWEYNYIGPCPKNCVYFSDKDNGWIAGKRNYKYNGSSFNSILGDVEPWLNGIHFANNKVGCMVGDDGYIIFTENSGEDWKKIEVETTNDLESCFFASENTGFIVGREGTIIKITLE